MMEPKLVKIEAVDVPEPNPEVPEPTPSPAPERQGRFRNFLGRGQGRVLARASQIAGLG